MAIEGQKIVEIREMTDDELEREFSSVPIGHNPKVLVLEDGTKLFSSQDPEGNGPGALFGRDSHGRPFRIIQ